MNCKQIMAKARGFTIGIGKINDKGRDAQPSAAFGDDYNRLRAETLKLLPDLEPLLPPSVETFENLAGSMVTQSSFSELDVYCEQIFQLVSDSEDSK